MQKLVYPSLKTGLVGAWCPSVDRSRTFDLTDFSGYGNNGILTNMDPGIDWVASDGKVAIACDGVDDYTDIPSTPYRPEFTATIWILKGTVNESSAYKSIFSRHTTLGAASDWFLYLNATDVLTVDVPWVAGDVLVDSVSRITTTAWSHVALTRTGTTGSWTYTLFVNGVQVASATTASNQNTGVHPINIGRLGSGTGATHYSSLLFDDIRIYNRAITPSEIALLAQRRGIGYETYRVPVARGAVAGGVTVTPTTVALTATKFAPTVLTPQTVTPPTEVLGAIGFAPTVTATGGATVTPVTAVLGATGFAPTVTICTPRSVTADTIQIRRGTVGCWTNVNPVLADGEFGLETDTRRMKIGDGATVYKSLAYITRASVRKTANYTLAIYDRGVFVDATGGAVTITLPTATSAKHVDFFVKKIDSSGNTVTIDAAGAETIDGALTQVISTQYTTVSIYSDATSWHVI